MEKQDKRLIKHPKTLTILDNKKSNKVKLSLTSSMQQKENVNYEIRTEHPYNRNKVLNSSISSEQMSISCGKGEEEKCVRILLFDSHESSTQSNLKLSENSNEKSNFENNDCFMKRLSDQKQIYKQIEK